VAVMVVVVVVVVIVLLGCMVCDNSPAPQPLQQQQVLWAKPTTGACPLLPKRFRSRFEP